MGIGNSLWLVSPEIFLSISSLVLLMVAAWGGDKSARLVTILSAAALFGASTLLTASIAWMLSAVPRSS